MKHLLLTICNDGSADDVMKVAKDAGALGGTILKGRGSAGKDTEKFVGITIQPGKELVLIVVEEEVKARIMQEISAQVGIGTKAHALTISLPVDEVVGLSF
jgi:nitrogen regulatory protein P-II 1